MEGGHIAKDGDMSARQAWMPVCATPWSGQSQNAEGTLGLIGRKTIFGYFLLFEKVTPAEGDTIIGASTNKEILKLSRRTPKHELLVR